VQVKKMIHDWEKQYPGRIDNMLTAMGNVVPSHLMDRNLYPFQTIKASGRPEAGGDIAFDEDEGCGTPADGASSSTLASIPVSVIKRRPSTDDDQLDD